MPMTQMHSLIRLFLEQRLSKASGGGGPVGGESGRHVVPFKIVILTSICKGGISPFAAMI